MERAALTGGRAALCRWLPDPSNDELTHVRGPMETRRVHGSEAWAAACAGSGSGPDRRITSHETYGGDNPKRGRIGSKVSKVRSEG